jgi:hypothetical protein
LIAVRNTSQRPLRIRSACSWLVLAILYLFPGTLRAQTVNGVVISGRDSSAVPGVTVLMHRITADAGEVVDSTATDARGRFSLSMSDSEDPAALFAAAALNDGVNYFGPAMHAGMEPSDPYTIVVHDTETIDGTLTDSRIMLRHVVVSPTAHGLVQITEVVDVAGEPGRALATASVVDPIWVIDLPAGIESWTPVAGGLPAEALSLVGNRVEVRAKLPPTGMRVAYAYFREGPEVELPVAHPTDRLEVILVGADEENLVGLNPGSSADLPPASNAKRFVATALEPGAAVGLTLESESAPTGAVLIWVIVGLLLLVAAGVSAALARRATG